VIATPGRLWELMDDAMEPYLVNGLPLIDFLVLDEADRMIADGHFRELRLILDFIYQKRVEYKKLQKGQKKELREDHEIDKKVVINKIKEAASDKPGVSK
jgi:hypothetical protein